LFFRIVPDSFNEVKLIEFLTQLRKTFRRKNIILVWDGLPSHRSRLMSAYLNDQRRGMSMVRLPAYAPDLNPVESVWSNIKGKELANRCADNLGGMVAGVREGFERIHSQRTLLHSFLNHAGLSL
jgi:transposase